MAPILGSQFVMVDELLEPPPPWLAPVDPDAPLPPLPDAPAAPDAVVELAAVGQVRISVQSSAESKQAAAPSATAGTKTTRSM
jgi:hypothetical protein